MMLCFQKNNIFNCQLSDLSNAYIIANISYMKRNLLLGTIFLYLISFGISSCSSNNTTGGQVNPNTIVSPFTVKYEIITSSPIVVNQSNTSIGYVNGTGQLQFDNSFTSGTTWTKEINVTTPSRPFNIALNSLGSLILTPGTATGKIYINGNQVANVVNPSPALIAMTYTVN
jgi:hypothetical protein